MEGKSSKTELNWIQEYFLNEFEAKVEARTEALVKARTEARVRTETVNAAIDFMRSNGMSSEQIDTFRNSFLKS